VSNIFMKIVILAAGEGQRLRPLTLTLPKPLVPIGKWTTFDILIESLPKEIDEIILVVRHLGHLIKNHCKNKYPDRKIFFIDGSKNGNALGFIKTKHLLKKDERFAVAYADDILSKKEIRECLKNKYSWLCYEASDPTKVGIATLDKEGFIDDVTEKPEKPLSKISVNGFMVINYNIFNYEPKPHKNGEYFFTSMMRQFIKDHRVKAVIGDKHHSQLTSIEDIPKLEMILNKYFV